MTVNVLHFDAFTLQPGKGNPAGIVLPSNHLTDAEMQAIAQKVGFNDTAFVLPSNLADCRIRYFSPRREVDLCGHATIAAFVALRDRGFLSTTLVTHESRLETRAGILPITVERSESGEAIVIMSQGAPKFSPFGGSREALVNALEIAVTDLHPSLPVVYGSTGRWTLVVPVRNLEVMRRMRPHPQQFPVVLSEMPEASIHPFCLEAIAANADMHARHFSSPASGTIEDAVTGTASGVLGAYHREFIDPQRNKELALLVEQGFEIGREGYVRVWSYKAELDHVVKIAGTACFVRDILIES